MKLTDEDVAEFRRVYQEAYGEEMPLEEARMWAIRLVRLYRILLSPTPSEMAAGAELLEKFRSALTDDERRIAELRAQGIGWEEVAQRLGGNGQARRMQLSRGVERVVKQLGLDD